MKTRIFIIVLYLFFSDIYAIGGELYISVKTGTDTTSTYNVYISKSGYSWDYNKTTGEVILDNQSYPLNYINQPTAPSDAIKLDSPDDKNTDNNYIGWGLMTIEFSWGDKYTAVTIDFRDENWSKYGPYSSHDTHLYLDQGTGIVYYTVNGYPEAKITNATTIWDMWHAGNYEPIQYHFNLPVVLKNRIEGESFDFGYLMTQGKQINSGENGLFPASTVNTISHGTIDKDYNNKTNHSFKWTNNSKVEPVTNQNIYGGEFEFKITDEVTTKEITRKFKTVYKLTVKNNLAENNGISADEIYFKDPTIDPHFHLYSAAGSGFVKNDAFDSLSIDVGDSTNQKYAIKAKPNFAYQGRTYYWQDGDFNPNTQTDLILTGPLTRTANYKGTQLSNNINAYKNNSQRKIVRIANGDLYMVYESLGKVWLEKSTDNGSTWSLSNGGQPLSGNNEAKNPVIDFYGNTTAVVLQEKSELL